MIISVLYVLQLQGRFILIDMTKDQLRKLYRAQRNSLSIEEKQAYNSNLLEKLKSFEWEQYTYVHVYIPLEKFNEPDTIPFISWIREYSPHIHLVTSQSDFKTGEMKHYLLEDTTQLVENHWGILEPLVGEAIAEEMLDVILVPLLVVDSRGNRVGYGKGFYDRFMGKCRADVLTIGISFYDVVPKITDVSEWDIPLKCCVTPNKIYYF